MDAVIKSVLKFAPAKYARYVRLGLAIAPLMNANALDELIRVAEDGDITWSDWMRVGRRAGLKGSS
jgi:hypothetical protein